MIHKQDALKFMEEQPNSKYNLIYTDVPYNLGSEYVIDKSTGHYKFKGKGSDFMSQWEAFDGVWWNEFFRQAYRILKPGGFFITHNIDRQSDLWTYYARRNDFQVMQKLYWLYLGSMAKGANVDLQIDNYLGVKRNVIGQKKGAQAKSTGRYGSWGKDGSSSYDVTEATSELAIKYEGYKYGKEALKQVMEEILVLWKNPEIKVPKQIERHEQGSRNIHPSVYNIKATRPKKFIKRPEKWTPQLAVDEKIYKDTFEPTNKNGLTQLAETAIEVKFLMEDVNPYAIHARTSTLERNEGLNEKNPHPSPKPLGLCKWVLTLFKLPDPETMLVFDPFVGQGSIPIACEYLEIPWEGTEINEDYIRLAEQKLKYHKEKIHNELDLFG